MDIHFCSTDHPQSNGLIKRLHTTLIEHLRLLIIQGFSITPIYMNTIYATLAYNHSSSTELKPIVIINGHINTNDPLNRDIEKTIMKGM